MLFRDTGGGPEVTALRQAVNARARDVLAEIIDSLAEARIPPEEVEPLAQLMSMGMASLALWWMDDPGASRDAVRDAMARVWTGVLSDAR
jgi:AcrR family transcriptional regulator